MRKEHCCDTMRARIAPVCDQHPDPWDCNKALMVYWPREDAYGIMNRIEGERMTSRIRFCRWCGDPKRDLSDARLDALEELGIDWATDPVPEDFQTDTWWRRRGL
ncbi:DUF6980 family protein [Roseisalinus antarcticus]|uniref:DUF6980 domain-containing protein n=1 Tax=Roseisalinus antarcticus TaxID=254357 RepID=A0A1Y5SDZ8_9RHOB|nr:hypothetical protein [Roseisalinus antarcticus]SLN35476.1 hypothetical protein ROA7023_01294 [Roseisalinus antarcticus]